jgi:hypothetical protein
MRSLTLSSLLLLLLLSSLSLLSLSLLLLLLLLLLAVSDVRDGHDRCRSCGDAWLDYGRRLSPFLKRFLSTKTDAVLFILGPMIAEPAERTVR